MNHPIFSDLEMSTAIVLVHCDGRRTQTRGQVTYAPRSRVANGSDLAGPVSRLTVHPPRPVNTSKVATIEGLPGAVRRVIASDPVASGGGEFASWPSVRYHAL